VQVATLYTSAAGERRVRVVNASMPVTATLAEVFRYADMEAVTSLLLRQVRNRLVFWTIVEEISD
jgi:protein transport protein SEC24